MPVVEGRFVSGQASRTKADNVFGGSLWSALRLLRSKGFTGILAGKGLAELISDSDFGRILAKSDKIR
jgi:hypothetical protein